MSESARITELLAANNRFEERARVAERQVKELRDKLASCAMALAYAAQKIDNVKESG